MIRNALPRLFFLFLLLQLTSLYGINILFQDDFEGYAAGIYPNNPSGSGAAWQGPDKEGTATILIEVSSTASYSGSNSLKMDKTDQAGEYIRAIASFNQSTQNIIFIDYYVLSTDDPPVYPCAIISYRDSSNKEAIRISFGDDTLWNGNNADDHVYYFSGGTPEIDSGFVYSLSTWYNVRIVADQVAKEYSIYIDNMAIPIVSSVPYYDATAGYIEKIYFDLDATAPEVYFDDIRIFESNTPPTADTTPPNNAEINSANPLVSIDNPVIDVDFSDNPGGDLDSVFYKVDDNSPPFTEVIATNISGEEYTQNFQIDSAYWDVLGYGDSLDIYFMILDDGVNYTISTTYLTIARRDYTRQKESVTILSNVIKQGEETEIRYVQDTSGSVRVTVFSLDGKLIAALYSGQSNGGEHTYTWDGRNRAGSFVARGIYFIKVVGPGVDETRKVLVVK